MKKLIALLNKNIISPTVKLFTENKSDIKPLITISREKGSGGRPIAFLVSKKLGGPWKVYHKEIVEEIAKETHLQEELVKEVDESRVSIIQEIIDDFFGKKYLSFPSYYKHLLKILSTIGNRGKAVIVGRGANFLFPQSLKVRVICDKDQRVKWMMEYEKLTKAQAIRRVEEFDEKRLEYGRSIFSHDIRKAHHYDLVIRTSKDLSIEEAADLIVYLAKKRFKL